jgi:hypothetical protein
MTITKSLVPLFAVTATMAALPAFAPSAITSLSPTAAFACMDSYGNEYECGGQDSVPNGGCAEAGCQDDHHPVPCEGHGTINGNAKVCNWDIQQQGVHHSFVVKKPTTKLVVKPAH